MLKVGEAVPSFQAKEGSGKILSQQDFLGSPFVIYFYPKDDTSGCTLEACSFRDSLDDLKTLDVKVIGVSPDSLSSHLKFAEKHRLNFPLLSDEKLELARSFGVLETKPEGGFRLIRSTFISDGKGIIKWVESPVKVDGHVERVKKALQSMAQKA